MRKYTSICLDQKFIKKVDAAVEKNPFVVSRAEFCRRAIEEFIKKNDGVYQ